MKEDINKYEVFELYLKGQLSEKEREAFEAELAGDEVLKKEFLKHQQLYGVINDYGHLQLKEQLNNIHRSGLKFKKRLRNWGFGTGFVVLAVIAFMYSQKNETPMPFKENAEVVKDSMDITETITEKIIDTVIVPKETKLKVLEVSYPQDKIDEKPKVVFTEKSKQLDSKQDDNKNVTQNTEAEVEDAIPSLLAPIEEKRETDNHLKVDCDTVEIQVNINTKESCNNKSTGSIEFDSLSLIGGIMPYVFSIDKGKSFSAKSVYSNIKAGLYHLKIKDGNDCMSDLGYYRVERKDCTYEFAFSPLNYEVWKVPTEEQSGTLYIYSKQGRLVYSRRIENYEIYEWDGRMESGDIVPMAMYRFMIKFDNKTEKTGYVTVVK